MDCCIDLYGIKGAAPPRLSGCALPVRGRDPRAPALARLRAPPPLTVRPAQGRPGEVAANPRDQLTREPPTRRLSIRPAPGRVKGATRHSVMASGHT